MKKQWARAKAKISEWWLRFRAWLMMALLGGGLAVGIAMAATKDFSWTNPTQNTDGSAFDAATELAEVRIYCGVDPVGFTPESPGAPQLETPTLVSPGAATTAQRDFAVGTYTCFATAFSVYGYESDPSNTTTFTITPTIPPARITDFTVQ